MRRVALFVLVTAATRAASAGVVEPSERPDEQFDVMNLLAHHKKHDLRDETWNVYGQSTEITSFKLPFSAPYTNLGGSNGSLSPSYETSWTYTLTLFAGVKLWPGAEAYFAPELVAEQPLSGLKGLGGAIQNFELQKGGSATPQVYRSRLYLQQTIPLGGRKLDVDSNPMQLGGKSDSHKLVVRVGNFSVIDFLDKSSVAGDLRQSFFNMAFMTYAAYDFVADSRGYSWGVEAELDWDNLSIRFARMAPPLEPNSQPLTFALDKFYGDQLEIEVDYKLFHQPGALRLLGYRNVEDMGRFDDALAAYRADPSKNAASCTGYDYGSTNANAPDLCWVRRPNAKVGIGLNLEQAITKDVAVFFRGMYSDGRTEVYSFTSTDRSLSVGATVQGAPWHRPRDSRGHRLRRRVDLRRARGVPRGRRSRRVHRRRRDPRGARERLRALLSIPGRRLAVDVGRLPAHHEPRVQRRPRAGRRLRGEGSCRVLSSPSRSRRSRGPRRRARRATRSSASTPRRRAPAGLRWTRSTCTERSPEPAR